MKSFLLLILIGTLSYGQNGLGVELRLYDANSIEDPVITSILQNNGVFEISGKLGFTAPSTLSFFQLLSSGDLEVLKQDLLNYPDLVESAHIIDGSVFPDAGVLRIETQGIGVPTGMENGIVVTNDVALNQIFQDFNVYYYEQSYPDFTWDINLRVYQYTCDCDVLALLEALNQNSSVVEEAFQANAIYLLGVEAETKKEIAVYPNPTKSDVFVESSADISSFLVYDTSGKEICHKKDVSSLNDTFRNLSSGVYIIKCILNDGSVKPFRIIKS